MSQHVQDRWSPEPGPKDLACFLEVTGYPKTSLCGVSEMVAEGEGTGSSWLFLSKFPQNGMAKSLADTVTHRSPAGPDRPLSRASRREKKNNKHKERGSSLHLAFPSYISSSPRALGEDASGKTWFHALKRRRAPGSPAEGAAVR